MGVIASFAVAAFTVLRAWRRNQRERRELASLSSHERYELSFLRRRRSGNQEAILEEMTMIVLAIPLLISAFIWAKRFLRRKVQERRP